MKILVTGAKGFIGKNLIAQLRNNNYNDIFEYDIDCDEQLLDKYASECQFVYHLAGVNRPKNDEEFMKGNFGFTAMLLDKLKKHSNKSPILIASSIQAALDNLYGKSKKAAENEIFKYAKENSVNTYVYRLPNVFGKWCRPNYNSVVATFCYNIANGLPIKINNPKTKLNLVYIDDVVNEFIKALSDAVLKVGNYCEIPTVYNIELGTLSRLIESFKASRENLLVPDTSDLLTKKLYSTYLSYLSKDNFSYPLKMNIDNRGSFTEFIKTINNGQISINISKKGIAKGNHWHHTKNEKFLVIYGTGVIRFRKVGSEEIVEYYVNGDKLEVVDIPVGYTHNIENIGDTDMVTIMWANETFDPNNPDTYYLEV